jgi:hypothetical protein
VVAGVVALLLEANPALTPQQVISVLQQTAIVDGFTGAVPNNTWGGGKVNAYQALRLVLQQNSVGAVTATTLPARIYPNPGRSHFNIGLMLDAAAQVRLEVFDLSGRRLYEESWNAPAGYAAHAFPLENAVPGVYFARLSTAAGGTSTLRFVVN